MIKVNGIHHIAIMAADIREHIAFFSDVLGCKLSAIFDMHGVPGGVHAFLHMDDHSYFSVVQLPAVKDIPIQLGVTHAGTGAGPSAPGTMQHLAFRVDTLDDLLALLREAVAPPGPARRPTRPTRGSPSTSLTSATWPSGIGPFMVGTKTSEASRAGSSRRRVATWASGRVARRAGSIRSAEPRLIGA